MKSLTALFLFGVLASTANAATSDVALSPFEGVSTDTSSDDPDDSDPCVVVTCLYGKATGNAQKACSSAEKTFQNIKATKKHGIFDPTKTLKQRTKFINSCPSADAAAKKLVLSMYGKLKKI